MPFIKLNQPKYLRERSMLIADTDPDSTYFEVDEIPGYFTGGKNLLLIGGNKQLLKPGSNIEIEITDKNGNPVYHEINQYIESGTNKRAVSIYVYESTPTGIGWITIAGEAEKRPNGSQVPKSWRSTLNVKWSKRIRIYPFRENKTRVILKTPPVIKIKELVRQYLIPTGAVTTAITSQSGNYIDYQYEGGFTPANGYGFLTTTASYFSQSMVGSTISFNNIAPTLGDNESLAATGAGGQTDNYWTTQITEIINDTKAKTNSSYSPAVNFTTVQRDTSLPSMVQTFSTNGDGFNYALFEHVYQQDITWATQSVNFESWAKIDISELDPMCGDLKKVKIFKRSQGFQQYELAVDVDLDSRDLLAKDDEFALQKLLGNFTEQSTIDSYWEASYQGVASAPGSGPITSSNSSKFMGGVVISGSENLKDNFSTTRENARVQFKMKTADFNGDGTSTDGVELFKNGNYQVSFKLASEDVDDGLDGSKINIYVSGSAIGAPSETVDKVLLDTISNDGEEVVVPTSPGNKATVSNQTLKGSRGTNLAVSNATTVEISQEPESGEHELVYTFNTYRNGHASLILEVVSGRWYVANVSFKSVKQSGFTPNHTSAEFRMFADTQQQDIFDFKFEMYDNQNELVHTAYTQSLVWQGGNTAVTGDNNTIEGSLVIGNGILMKGITGTV